MIKNPDKVGDPDLPINMKLSGSGCNGLKNQRQLQSPDTLNQQRLTEWRKIFDLICALTFVIITVCLLPNFDIQILISKQYPNLDIQIWISKFLFWETSPTSCQSIAKKLPTHTQNIAMGWQCYCWRLSSWICSAWSADLRHNTSSVAPCSGMNPMHRPPLFIACTRTMSPWCTASPAPASSSFFSHEIAFPYMTTP